MNKLLITALFLLPQMLFAQIDDESTPVTLSHDSETGNIILSTQMLIDYAQPSLLVSINPGDDTTGYRVGNYAYDVELIGEKIYYTHWRMKRYASVGILDTATKDTTNYEVQIGQFSSFVKVDDTLYLSLYDTWFKNAPILKRYFEDGELKEMAFPRRIDYRISQLYHDEEKQKIYTLMDTVDQYLLEYNIQTEGIKTLRIFPLEGMYYFTGDGAGTFYCKKLNNDTVYVVPADTAKDAKILYVHPHPNCGGFAYDEGQNDLLLINKLAKVKFKTNEDHDEFSDINIPDSTIIRIDLDTLALPPDLEKFKHNTAPLKPTFRWEEVPGATHYSLQINQTTFKTEKKKDEDDSPLEADFLIENIEGNSYTMEEALTKNKYYNWQVKAHLEDGGETYWTLPQKIKAEDIQSVEFAGNFANALQVYPNPASKAVNISFELQEHANCKMMITDLLGTNLLTKEMGYLSAGPQELHFDISEFPAGIYFITVQSVNGFVRGRFVVE